VEITANTSSRHVFFTISIVVNDACPDVVRGCSLVSQHIFSLDVPNNMRVPPSYSIFIGVDIREIR
jgi:hypothetical protein